LPDRQNFEPSPKYPTLWAPACQTALIIADAAVHAISVCLGLIGAVTIVMLAVKMERIEATPILIYVIGLLTMLALWLPTTCGRSRRQVGSPPVRSLRD
jgi:hemolysin III